MQLAIAFGRRLRERHDGSVPRPAVFIGSHRLAHSDLVQSALQAGFNAVGVDVVHGGVLPTPAVASITRQRGFQGGVALAGSCQPFTEQGLRLFTGQGERLSEADERALAQQMKSTTPALVLEPVGRAWTLPSAPELYANSCLHRLDTGVDLRGLSVVLDCVQGSADGLAQTLLERLGARVCLSHRAAPPEHKPGADPLAPCPDHLSQAVRAHHADIGLALDGAGQRVLMCDASGRIFSGDELLYMLACDAQASGLLRGGVVGSVTSNLGLELALQRRGLAFARAEPGERALLALLRQRDWTLAGDPDGLLLSERTGCSDALMTALQVLSALRRSQRDMAALCSDLQLYAQCQINLAVPANSDWQHNTWLQERRERAEHGLGGLGRVLLHACEREPLLRLMVECPDARRAAAVALELAGSMGHSGLGGDRPISVVL
jgi:phosphoglucosamine mutase